MAAVLASSDADRVQLSEALERFFIEAISPFEIAHRSFRDANLVLHRLNDVLENQAKRIAYALHARGVSARGICASRAGGCRHASAGRAGQGDSVRARACSIRSRTASGASLTSCARPSSTTWDCCRRSNSWPTGSRSDGAFLSPYAGPSRGSLPLPVETAVYRAAQEGLTNVARHAQATCAEVLLCQSPHLITCSVRDDGKGCDPAVVVTPSNGRRGLGLVEIRERTAALGGTLRLVPRLEQGMDFIVEIPLEASTWA